MDPKTSSPPLLRLPREVRDMILSYAIIASTIALEPAVTKAPKSRIAVGGEVGFCEALYQQYKLAYPLTFRSTWTVPLEDLAIPEADFQLDSSVVHMTAQMASPKTGRRGSDPGTSILQVCKQLHSEATEIFYSKKTFSFVHDYGIPTATTFLRDRPATSLRHIKSLELSLTDVEQFPPNVDDSTQYSGRHVLQCDYGFYAELCNLLSSPEMGLRRLSLTIETRRSYAPRDMHPVTDALDLDNLKWSNAQGNRATDIVDWIHPLLEIKNLDHLSIFWINETHTRVIGRTAALMARHMLRNRLGPTTRQTPSAQETIEILYRAMIRSGMLLRSYAIVAYDPADESVGYKDLATGIWDDGRRLNVTAKGRGDHNYLLPERPLVRKYLDTRIACLTCYCELSAT